MDGLKVIVRHDVWRLWLRILATCLSLEMMAEVLWRCIGIPCPERVCKGFNATKLLLAN